MVGKSPLSSIDKGVAKVGCLVARRVKGSDRREREREAIDRAERVYARDRQPERET